MRGMRGLSIVVCVGRDLDRITGTVKEKMDSNFDPWQTDPPTETTRRVPKGRNDNSPPPCTPQA